MAKIAIIYCKKVKDYSCIACTKCYKAIREKNAGFSEYDEIELIAMTDCGDCPGIMVPRIKLLKEMVRNLEQDFDIVHFGTCAKLAMETSECPIDVENLRPVMKEKFNVDLVVGTHAY